MVVFCTWSSCSSGACPSAVRRVSSSNSDSRRRKNDL